MDLILAYLAGLLTLINPCVLPVLPIVLAGALQTSRLGPVALAAGMSVSFVVLGFGLAVFGAALGLTPEFVAKISAVVMIIFGIVLLVPRFSQRFEAATAGISARADAGIDRTERSTLRGQFLGGLLLGAVWVPCIGPTLGGAIALASTGQSLGWAGAIMISFAAGVSTIILGLGYGAQSAIRARQGWLRGLAARAKPLMGIIFILVGIALFFDLQRYAEGWLIGVLPYWLQDLSVRF
ncbi:MAG: cytochrome c biogenesis protein CcdA [Rhodobacteraceae bacterium]|nr:cytochrome c biogenesis protein CcdA [Paracoccaceae bacterium]